MTTIYAFGNVFEKKRKWTFCYFDPMTGNAVCKEGSIDAPSFKKFPLVGLSFENFLDMAREKGEHVSIRRVGSNVLQTHLHIGKDNTNDPFIGRIMEKNESLPSFLLRVAKERKYL